MKKINKIVKPERPAGFLDYGPDEHRAREEMVSSISKVFANFGFDPIETPVAEFYKVLLGEDETSKNIFSLRTRGNAEDNLALRFDHTVPFARFLAANPYDSQKKTGIRLPWRRSVFGPVFRGETPQKGRFRQFYQYDIDIAGSAHMISDAEIIAIIFHTLSLWKCDFKISINSRKILDGLTEYLQIEDRLQVSVADIGKEIMHILDKSAKISGEEFHEELTFLPDNEFDPRPNLNDDQFAKLQAFISLKGDNCELLESAERLFIDNLTAKEGVQELMEIMSYLPSLGVDINKIAVDFSIARGLDYYTGTVFESNLIDAPEFGSVFSGGRYNDLVSRFTGQELPAVGASIGVDRLFAALRQLNVVEIVKKREADILVLHLSDKHDVIAESLKIAHRCRFAGYKTEMSLVSDRSFKAQLGYAVSQNYRYVIIYGDDEHLKKTVEVKDLSIRQQVTVELSELENFLISKISKS